MRKKIKIRKTIENHALDTTYMVLKDGKNKKLKNCLFVYKTSMHERWDSRYKIRKEKKKNKNSTNWDKPSKEG